MASNSNEFSSEGFDLDSVPSSSKNEEGDVILELGGGVTKIPSATPKETEKKRKNDDKTHEYNPLSESERLKALGNEQFKAGNSLGAYDLYTSAIEACPGEIDGKKILEMKEEFEERRREKILERRRRNYNIPGGEGQQVNDENDDAKKSDGKQDDNDNDEDEAFVPPSHPHATALSVYHSNRAAALYHLCRHEECIKDCTISMLLNPAYVKPVIRRMHSLEATEKTDEALADAKLAFNLDPRARAHVTRLEKIEHERMEKLKAETMDKLKDLGNSILGNFGMSLDNFQAIKDPNTGSYSISYNNNA